MHANAFLKQMDETAVRMTIETRELLASEYEVMTEGVKFVNSIFHAEVALSAEDTLGDDTHKSARTMMVLRITNSLQAALMLQERGLVAESLSLCRDALETTFIWKHLELHPNEAQRWFDSAHDRKHAFNFAAVLDAMGDRDRIYPQFQSLCKFCHPTGMTFWANLRISPSNYDYGWRRFCCAQILSVMSEFIGAALGIHAKQLFTDESPLVQWRERAAAGERNLRKQFGADVLNALALAGRQLTSAAK